MNTPEISDSPLPFLRPGFDNCQTAVELKRTLGSFRAWYGPCPDVAEARGSTRKPSRWDITWVVVHHPLIFKGYKSITGRDCVERSIHQAIKTVL